MGVRVITFQGIPFSYPSGYKTTIMIDFCMSLGTSSAACCRSARCQQTSNVSKAHACAKQDTGHPRADRNAVPGESQLEAVYLPRTVGDRNPSGWIGWHWDHLWADLQDDAHSDYAHCCRQEKPRLGAIHKVPQNRVDEGEGERGLGCTLPGQSAL